MVLVAGKWYIASVELNGLVMAPILLVIFIAMTIKQVKSKKFNWIKEILTAAFLLYLWFLFDLTLFPIFIFSPNLALYHLGLGKGMLINFNFNELRNYLPLQIIGNLLLLMPLSFFAAIFKEKYRRFWPNLSLMFCSSLLIELLQLVMNFFYLGNRSFDVNDLLLNTLGSVIGWGFYKLISLFLKKA